ncbi:alpha/beta hydrolase [Paractinoplanes brasiliensis]|uniref:Alpha/beta hydrolase family protein n=1 Tax=Paractinoplanes brasiliensis TaxID=52695 RepID=A0A4R6JQL0_9ACTN|nr:alpha/beta hydrolase [Actinoplanes brasiliensis]TDO36915.1 alpha/beta hydrolase family protein [Actinoplanes brasiliensis]GID30436.1 alpha/beta hydrolase [Actinoplanes brasiliensis]
MYRKRGVVLVGVVALLGTFVVAGPAAVAREAAAGLTWEACPAEVVMPAPVAVQCAKIHVPLDYRDPDGEQIDIMISKIASTNPAKRRGILLLNPGGPGGIGIDQGAFLVSRGLPATVSDAYDLIGMDTRGVGGSTRMSCGFTLEDPYWANIPPYAVDDAAVTRQAVIAKQVADKCAANDKQDRLRHLSTANTARDLDRVRAALGEKKASFYGASYGSALGAAYVSLFPKTTDRIVLDSNVGDTHLDRAGLRRFGLGFEQTFPDFARWAAARHDAYGLGRTPQQVRRAYLKIAGRLDQAPAPDGVDGAVFRYLTFAGLYSEMLYGRTARIWQTYLHPSTTPAAKQAATPSPQDTAFTAFLATTCNDVDWPEDVATYRRAVAEDRRRYPLYGAATANITPCANWKHEPYEPPVQVDNTGPANILILQNRRDPVTPWAGGKLLRDKFAQRAKLVTAEESGHGVFLVHTNACALNITTDWLVEGRMPARDTSCRAG